MCRLLSLAEVAKFDLVLLLRSLCRLEWLG